MNKEFFSRSVEETREYARRFAAGLGPGDVVCLNGELGAGKTEFVRGITQVFNCDEQLSSPTFSIFNIYHGSLKGCRVELHHFDLYRIEREEELDAIGFEEYVCGPFISVVEWSEKFPGMLPGNAKKVFIESAGENQRRIVIDAP
ncbi:tRNA (adenosine(37)-N6)-threonylcarbamoyltransferase complex ATPase subunit type 1 TsaE [Prosthecochloris sp. HL-130-GSB]|jgi:tRNA threonylcarbamoyladenosine biosynthesis protein TsaE|uniref:tRNA (adenosine(37)-N6)-threonylcarbamoyltransferase complex ATPase subunit type 1 TsaE n=1 Tax=Prosthecochloris sp. HL-130-GSB TaxID=1974213 RepID=UPI000A1C11A2|nr:tRNA (adenosine(37)-N6)-threonylcarbamoyltransferase complex ATPase subunit type 1 TsaE [Prosthecochloris sp. HL-130-GSB]ARM30101.1 tRNA (adenosine(37)-N6)-threonylcarbamoyltransferase complex ATPase subunit type 1 TsaE [Prosthecochloris sp. HL-130-GSB]MBO8092271.1 tRNA (adenosine(37)-N6)-threonylcarbamoyltransferase complex ATPase subunit type 1 TsaE [Prosthecochloris sp.]